MVSAVQAGPTVRLPARCAVAVICGDQLISQVYPAAVPIEAFLDNAVELLDEELRRRGGTGLQTGTGYEFLRVNGTRLEPEKSFDELGVEDGEALMLAPPGAGDPFEAQCESLSTGLARTGRALFTPMTARTAVHLALVALLAATATLLAAGIRHRLTDDSVLTTLVTGAPGVAALFAAVVVRRLWPRRTELRTGFGAAAVPALAVAAATAAPGPLGAAHVFIGALTAAVAVVGVGALRGRPDPAATAVTATLVSLCTLLDGAAALRMWRPVPAQWLGMIGLIALLLAVTLAPTIALRAARIRPPHFGSITGRDLFRRADGLPADAVAPVDERGTDAEPNSDTTARGADIAAAARRGNAVLTGLCAAIAVALPPAVWLTLMPGRPRATAAAWLAGLFLVIFAIRARNFADRKQSAALLVGVIVAVCAGVSRYLWAAPADSGSALICAVAALTGFGALVLIAALLVPATRFTPLVRMAAEWAELVAIVIALPLAAWIGGLFAWVRMR